MAAFRDRDSGAGAQLMELFYPELKRLAAGQLQGERRGRSLQPTLLVNEVYLLLILSQDQESAADGCRTRQRQGGVFRFGRPDYEAPSDSPRETAIAQGSEGSGVGGFAF
jgi:ECF sigma factor